MAQLAGLPVIFGGSSSQGFFDEIPFRIIETTVRNNNARGIRFLMLHGFSLAGNCERAYDLLHCVKSRMMLKTLHDAGADIRMFDDYFLDRALFQHEYDLVEYFEEQGASPTKIEVTEADKYRYLQALEGYTRWKSLVDKVRNRCARNMYFRVMSKIYKNPVFVMEQAARSYDRNFGK